MVQVYSAFTSRKVLFDTLQKEIVRKSIHLMIALVPTLAAWNYRLTVGTPDVRYPDLYTYAEFLRGKRSLYSGHFRYYLRSLPGAGQGTFCTGSCYTGTGRSCRLSSFIPILRLQLLSMPLLSVTDFPVWPVSFLEDFAFPLREERPSAVHLPVSFPFWSRVCFFPVPVIRRPSSPLLLQQPCLKPFLQRILIISLFPSGRIGGAALPFLVKRRTHTSSRGDSPPIIAFILQCPSGCPAQGEPLLLFHLQISPTGTVFYLS